MVALRIFDGNGEEPDPSHRWNLPPDACLRLRDYYDRFVVPDLVRTKRAKKTFQAYATAIGRWEEFSRSQVKDWNADQWGRMNWTLRGDDPDWISNPPIGFIVDDDLKRFQDDLIAAGFPSTTVNTTLRSVQPILNHAAPRGERGGGRGVLLLRPHVRDLETEIEENYIPSEDEVAAFFDVTWDARWPEDSKVPAPFWWQGLVVFLCNYGLACSDWKKLVWNEHVLEDCTQLRYVRTKNKRKRKHPVLFEINATTRWYLQRMLSKPRIRQGKPQLFYSARSRNYFEPEWRRLTKKAGVSRIVTKKDGKSYELFDRHALRRFCNQYFNDRCDGQPGEWLLNHAFTDKNVVNHRHYSKIFVPPQHVTDALHSIEQLPCFTELMKLDDKQAS